MTGIESLLFNVKIDVQILVAISANIIFKRLYDTLEPNERKLADWMIEEGVLYINDDGVLLKG